MNAYMVVGPTKLQPRFFRSFASAIDSGEVGMDFRMSHVSFLGRDLDGRLDTAREALGAFVGADPDDLAGDMPRTVRITPVGRRWEGIELPLLGLADRL